MATKYKTLIIGAGFGGLCMAAKLKEKGDNDFLIIEKGEGVGGTWRENSYPGAGCDIPSALYSYSFARKYDWQSKWAKQPEILAYIEKCVDDFGLRPHLSFNTSVKEAAFKTDHWVITLNNDERLTCQFLVSAVGQLHHPKTPDFVGLNKFKGKAFHSARWDHAVNLSDKRVAVIGNAASAVQLIPKVAKQAKSLTVYHRSANWVVGKEKLPFWIVERMMGPLFKKFGNFDRFQTWALGEFGLWRMIKRDPMTSWIGRRWFRKNLKQSVTDKALQEKLTPDYPIGAKRVLLSDDFFPALMRDNVDLVFEGVKTFDENGIIDSAGITRQHDVVVFATGFYSNPFLKEIDVLGEASQSLKETWHEGAYAYYGTMTSGFPNLFILYGPNTNTGHSSIIFKLEQQVGYVMQLMSRAGDGHINVKPDAEGSYNEKVQARLSKLAWAKIEESWYKDGDRVTNNWPGSSWEFKRKMSKPDWSAFEVSK